MHSKIEELLKLAVVNKASDVHLSSETAPSFRINGKLQVVEIFLFRYGEYAGHDFVIIK